MILTIRNKADAIATFRYVSVQLMETLARWVPVTPELEVKTLFGRHIWDLAQHADHLGKRTVELRAALHYNRAPLPAFTHALQTLDSASNSAERIAGFYDGAIADLERRYRQYLDATDRLLDEPSVRIVERVLLDFARMHADRNQVLNQRRDLSPPRQHWLPSVQSSLAAVQDWVDFRPPQASTVEVL